MSSEPIFDGEGPVKVPPVLQWLTIVSAAMMATAVWMIFFDTPEERVMGFVQKIFYFHVPSAWGLLFVGVPLAALGSVMFLIKRDEKWDRIGDVGVEIAILFGAMVLFSGPLWGRKAWGVYWVWDVRLTSTLVLVLTLVACKIVRTYAGPSARTVSAGLALFALINSVFVYYSVDYFRGTHPPKVVQNKLDPDMARTFWFCVATFMLTAVCLTWTRLRLGALRSALDRLHMRAAEEGYLD
jgi:heme exporter protein C